VKARTRVRKAVVGGGRRALWVLLAVAVAGVLTLGMIRGGPQANQAAPSPAPPDGAPTSAARSPEATASDAPSPEPLKMGSSRPATIAVPAIKVDARLQVLGQKKDNLVELPKKPRKPGWYKKSATPGELGIATVVGYIRKSADEPGVFNRLGKLDKGDRIEITRANDSVAIFKVDKIKFYPVEKFSTEEVYGLSEPRAELRVITSGGSLEPGDPRGNAVVFAHLVDTDGSGTT
jgi:sortase (surface protein transpeptidase)